MSEEILKALMQLFGLLTKQDGGVESNETEYVRNFLKQQLNTEAVEEYFALFLNHSLSDEKEEGEEAGKVRLTSMKDSVRILGICKKINKQLNREQKVVVLIRMFELISTDMKLTEQRMAIINTVAQVFKLPKNEISAIETFVLYSNEREKLNTGDFMIIDNLEGSHGESKHISKSGLEGSIIILSVKSAELYFMRYTGEQEIFLNGMPVDHRRIYIFPKGSFIRIPKGTPIYYTDVVGHFLTDADSPRISYEVKNVGYTFKNGTIGLRNININEEQGRLIGIMGASGAGKTTLLNVLSGIESPTEGEVVINGHNLHTQKEELEGVIGLIPQDDLLIEELTVFENLYYNAKLCFKDKSEEEITALVHDTLQNLGLFERKDLKVGSPLNKTISGGQRKRLNIALELIREPAILFVDEPTSGLSSRDSENVMNLLRELALKGKLIFVVIHQPSSDIYKMFDKMFILDTGGYPVYYGNPGESLIYFKQLDSQINSDQGECPTCGNLNPELIFNIIDASVIDEYGNYTNKRKVAPEEWYSHFCERIAIPTVNTVKTKPPKTLNIPSWFNQFKIYTLRDFFAKISNTQYILLNLLETPLLGFILAYLIKYIANPNSDLYIFRENENMPPYVFMGIVVSLFFGLIISAEEIFKDAKILKRESFLKLSRSSYLVSKVLLMFTISAIQMALFVLVANTVLGIKDMYFEYWIALFTVSAFANILGLILSASFNSIVTIYILIPLVMIPQMVLGGAMFTFDKLNKDFTSVDKVPAIAEFMPSRWIYEGLIVDMYKNNKYNSAFFEIEQKESSADFKQVHYLPELREILVKCYDHVAAGKNRDDKTFKDDLELIRNEFSKEIRRVPEINFENLDLLYPDTFDENALLIADDYISKLNDHYRLIFIQSNRLKDTFFTYNQTQNAETFNRIKDNYYNESISSIVRREFGKNKMVRQGNELVQLSEPIYQIPEPEKWYSFRTHFFAPVKHFAGNFYETLWFNITVVWLLTIVLYAVLYFDLLTKLMNWGSSIKWNKRKPLKE